MAATLGICERTLRDWAKLDPSRPRRRGPRQYTEEQEETARALVSAELDRMGWSCGERTLVHELGDRVPRRLLRRVLATLKAEHTERLRSHLEEARISIAVLARDTAWTLDATHLGRNAWGASIEGEVVREISSAEIVWVGVGPPSSGEDVVAMLEWLRRLRGGLPLVLISDNGAAYRSRCVRLYLRRHRVTHIFNEPYTPQHNPWGERAHAELKAETGLGKGVRLEGPEEARARIAPALERLNEERPRLSRGWRTPAEAYRATPPWSLWVDREAFFRAARCAEAAAVVGCKRRSRLRRARREAQLATLECFGLIRRTRGDARRRASILET